MTARKKITPAMKADLIGRVKPYTRTADQKATPAQKPARTPLNGLTATGQLARPKTGGRQAGSRNKKEVSDAMLGDILAVYQELGGVKFLLKYAQNNPGDFVKTVLARLMPTPYVEPTDTPPAVSINLNEAHSDYMRQAALQIAFALEKGVRGDPSRTIEYEPVTAETKPVTLAPGPPPAPPPVAPAPYLPESSAPVETFESLQEQAAREVARELVANTLNCDLGNYPGSSGEQGLGKKKRS